MLAELKIEAPAETSEQRKCLGKLFQRMLESFSHGLASLLHELIGYLMERNGEKCFQSTCITGRGTAKLDAPSLETIPIRATGCS